MSRKVLWVDTETTGVNRSRSAVIEIAALVEIDYQVICEFNETMAPFPGADINVQALKINGRTRAEIMTFPPPNVTLANFAAFLDQYIDAYNKADKFAPAGFKIDFDTDFLRNAYKREGFPYFGSYVSTACIDVMTYVGEAVAGGLLSLPNNKLKTLCDHFEIPLDAHKPMNDIYATRTLYAIIGEVLRGERKG